MQHTTPQDPYAINWSKTNSGWGCGPYSITA
jgi:hypothetical protein